MNPRSSVDVLICGAGAAGLALAIELARRRVEFRLVEKSALPFAGSRGKGIQPRSQEVFEDMGVLDRLFARGGCYPPTRMHHADGSHVDTVASNEQPTAAEPYQQALLVPQFVTEDVLRERLAELGARPEYGHELLAFEQDPDGVSARVGGPDGEEFVRCRYLVGTDGGRSFLRQALGIDFPGKTLGVRAVVADITLTGLAHDAWHRFNADDMTTQVALCAMPGTNLFQLQAPIAPDDDPDLSAQGLTDLLRSRIRRDDVRVDSVSWASAYSMSARLADRYRAGRVFIAGDAAHVHPPTGGQGLNTSVQDAYNLGWKLAAVIGGAPTTLLDTYEQERRPVAAEMLGLSTKLLDEAKRGAMRRGREVRQLDIGYPASSLAWLGAERAAGALVAGARAPDAPLRGAAGQPTRLFELFKGVHWTLIGYRTTLDIVDARPGLHIHAIGDSGDLRDDGGHFADAYRPSPGDMFLVRPDGYIAAIVDSAQRPALTRFLDEVGLTAGVARNSIGIEQAELDASAFG